MKMNIMKKSLFAAAVCAGAVCLPANAANLVLRNVDPPNVGFNDPTPATPVGGNSGTTVGGQRLIAYQKALELWGKTLRSNVDVVVRGSFAGLSCTAGGGTLAQAGALSIFSDFPGAPLAGHWYGAAIANALAGQDLDPGGDDIVANFNGNVGKPTCVAGPGWYYGLDNNAGPGQIDFLDTFMHEVAHGLGFQNFVSEATGARPAGLPDVYMANTKDVDTGKFWNVMTAPEIVASAVNAGRVVWTGANVTAGAPIILGPYEGIRLTGTLTKDVEYGTASFGPAPNPTNFSGAIVRATTVVGGAGAFEGCTAISSSVSGKVALIDRGVCGFAVKAKNAQNAGAVAVIIANTLGRTATGMGGVDATMTIPSVMVGNADGDAIKAALPGVSTDYYVDPTRRAGTTNGLVRLYAPRTVEPGSSGSHFDTVASPNLLMEPAITDTLRSARNLDLTPALMKDIGWQMETLKVGACDSGVPSALANGQLLHADVEACSAGAKNHGQFVACMATVVDTAARAGLLADHQRGAVMSCAARGR